MAATGNWERNLAERLRGGNLSVGWRRWEG